MQRQLFPYQYGGDGLLHHGLRAVLRGWEDLHGDLLVRRRPTSPALAAATAEITTPRRRKLNHERRAANSARLAATPRRPCPSAWARSSIASASRRSYGLPRVVEFRQRDQDLQRRPAERVHGHPRRELLRRGPAEQGRVRLRPRPQRLRQEHDPAADRRPVAAAPAHRGRGAGAGPARSSAPAPTAAWSSRITPASTTARCWRTSPSAWSARACAAGSARSSAASGSSTSGLNVDDRRRQVSARAVRRHAAAGGHRPDAHPPAAHHPHGRAVRRPRPADPHGHAGPAGLAVAGGAGDGVLRDPFDRGGRVSGRPGLRDGPRRRARSSRSWRSSRPTARPGSCSASPASRRRSTTSAI